MDVPLFFTLEEQISAQVFQTGLHAQAEEIDCRAY